jgi:ABC-type nitrate/sulfonate/bicarbonate transport system substrate-binding protein
VPKLFATYKAAADWIVANPDDAAKLIAPKDTPEGQTAVANLIKANDRLGLNVRWASDVQKEIRAVYAAGQSTGFLGAAPAASSIYRAP